MKKVNASKPSNTVDDKEYQRVVRELSRHGPECPVCKKPMEVPESNPEESKQWRCTTREETKCAGTLNVSRRYLALQKMEALLNKK